MKNPFFSGNSFPAWLLRLPLDRDTQDKSVTHSRSDRPASTQKFTPRKTKIMMMVFIMKHYYTTCTLPIKE